MGSPASVAKTEEKWKEWVTWSLESKNKSKRESLLNRKACKRKLEDVFPRSLNLEDGHLFWGHMMFEHLRLANGIQHFPAFCLTAKDKMLLFQTQRR